MTPRIPVGGPTPEWLGLDEMRFREFLDKERSYYFLTRRQASQTHLMSFRLTMSIPPAVDMAAELLTWHVDVEVDSGQIYSDDGPRMLLRLEREAFRAAMHKFTTHIIEVEQL